MQIEDFCPDPKALLLFVTVCCYPPTPYSLYSSVLNICSAPKVEQPIACTATPSNCSTMTGLPTGSQFHPLNRGERDSQLFPCYASTIRRRHLIPSPGGVSCLRSGNTAIFGDPQNSCAQRDTVLLSERFPKTQNSSIFYIYFSYYVSLCIILLFLLLIILILIGRDLHIQRIFICIDLEQTVNDGWMQQMNCVLHHSSPIRN